MARCSQSGVTCRCSRRARRTAPCPPPSERPDVVRRRRAATPACERVVRAGWQGSGVGHRAAAWWRRRARACDDHTARRQSRSSPIRVDARAQRPTILADDDPQPAAPRAKRRWRRRRRHGVRHVRRVGDVHGDDRHGQRRPARRTIVTSGCPNHYSVCTGKGFGVCGAQGVEGTDTEATEQGKTLAIPASPVLISGSRHG